jgi:predicted GIY-YIG superfamily endonuclease
MAQKKNKTVYLLRNTNSGEVEYVGCTENTKRRFRKHIKDKPVYRNGDGKFYGRTDLELVEVKEFTDKKEAHLYEGKLKTQYGFEWTEKRSLPKEFYVFEYKTKKLVGKYDSYYSAFKDLGFNNGNMCQVISGKRNQTNGYYGRYETN